MIYESGREAVFPFMDYCETRSCTREQQQSDDRLHDRNKQINGCKETVATTEAHTRCGT
jgi:hypothetical protein